MAFKKKAIAKEVQQNFKLLEDLRSPYRPGGGIQKYDEIGFGRGLNESLRGLNADSKPLSDFVNYFSYERAKALQSDLMTAKTNPQITYRGLSSGSLMPEKLAESIGLNPDRPFFDRSFMATTPNRSYASSYGTDVYLSVLGASGYRMPTRGIMDGGEVLYPAGNLFDVENYRKRGWAVTATLVDRNLTPKQIKSLKTNILNNEYSDIDRSFQESSNAEPSTYRSNLWSNLFEYGQKFQDKKTGDIKSLDLVKGDTATLRSIDGALEVLSVNELKNRYEIKAPTDMKSFNQGDGVISNVSDLRYTVLGDDGDYVRLLGLNDNVREINRAQLKKEYRPNTLGFATYPALTSGLLGTAGIVGGATAGKLLAKSLGANEDQQNVAAGIGGAIGGLTGVTTGYIGDGVTMPKSFRDMAKRAMGVKSNSEAGMVAPNKVGDQILDSLNPTGGIFAGYSPEARVKAKLAKNIKTLADTMRVSPDDLITVYRGSAFQDSINDGDFVTTNKQLAKDYAGGGKVLSQTVRYGDILDDINEPLGDEYILRKGAYEQINSRSADKKINTGSVSSSVKEPKMPKLTTDTLYKYLQMMGGDPVIVKPDGSQATKGKFAFGQDIGLNNEFTKLPEIHTRFDDPKIASMVAKELATGELTVGMQRNPETGEIETVTKKFQPIPSRGNTQLRRYKLQNDTSGYVDPDTKKWVDTSGHYLAFNKPEEAYKAPKSLKELQADTRKAYQSFGLKPNATIAELQAAVQPIVNEVRASQDLRDRLATVLVDMKNRPELEPVPLERGWDKVQSRSPMIEQTELAPQKQAIAPEPQPRLNPATDTGGWANAQGESLVTLENVDQKRMQVAAERSAYANQKAPFASQRLAEVDRYGVGAPLDDEAAYNLAKRKFETIKRSALEFPDTFQGVDQSAKFPSFSNLKRQALSEGIMLADSGTNAFKAYADAKAAELTGTLKIPESGLPVTARLGQEYISPKTGKIGTVESVGKKGVKLNVDGQVVPLEYRTLERLKYTGNKGYGLTANTAMDLPLKFAKGFAMREGARLLAKQLGADEDQQQAVADTVTAANVLGSVYQNVAKKSDIFSQADRANILNNKLPQYDVKPVLSDAAVLATDLLTPHPYGIATVPAARMATDSWKNNYDAIAERGLAAMKTTATGATGAIKDFTYQTLSQLGRSVGLPFPMTEQAVGQVLDAIPNAEQVLSMAKKYTGKKGYGFARIPALAAVTTSGLGVAGGYGAGRALAKALGMDEDQQNLAGVIGGVTGGLTGAIAPASLDYKLAGIAQPVFRVRDMRLPTPQEVGKAFFMPERNPELGMFRMDAIAPSESQRSQSPTLSEPTTDRPQTLSELQRQPDRPQTKGFSNPQSELAIARRELDAKYPYSPPYDRTAKPESRKLVPFLTFDQAVDQMSMSPSEYRAFQDRVYAEQKTVKSKQYKERQSQIAKQKFQQVQSYSDALKAWNKAGDPTIPMPRKEDFVSPIKNTFDFKQTLSEASMAARSAESRVKGFSKPQPKSAIAQATQAIKNAGEIVFDALYQPSAANPSRASFPKQSTFIAESEVQKAAAARGVSEARVKAEIANQRASGETPNLSKATEAAKPPSAWNKLPAWQSAPVIESSKIAALPSTPVASIKQSEPNRLLAPSEVAAKSRSIPSSTLQAFEGSNAAFIRNIAPPKLIDAPDIPVAERLSVSPQKQNTNLWQLVNASNTGRAGKIGDFGIKAFGVSADVGQAVEAFNKSVSRGESAPLAVTRSAASVGAFYGTSAALEAGATSLAARSAIAARFLPAPVRLAAVLGLSYLAATGADEAISKIVGVDERKQAKYSKDMSKLGLSVDPDSELYQPFGNAEPDQAKDLSKVGEYSRAYANSLVNTVGFVPQSMPWLGRSLAELTNKDSIENARYQSERQTSLQAGMDAKAKKSIAFEKRDDGTEVGYLRNRGYNATESRVLALQNLANESGYETPRTGKFDAKTLDALEKLGYSQSQISAYIKGKTKAIGKPNQVTPDKVNAVKIALARSRGEQVSSSQLSAALSAERKAQGLKGGEMLNQGQVDRVFSSLAGRSLTQLRQSAKVGGNKTQSALRLGAGIR